MNIAWDPNDAYTSFFAADANKTGLSLEDYDSRKLSNTTIDSNKNA